MCSEFNHHSNKSRVPPMQEFSLRNFQSYYFPKIYFIVCFLYATYLLMRTLTHFFFWEAFLHSQLEIIIFFGTHIRCLLTDTQILSLPFISVRYPHLKKRLNDSKSSTLLVMSLYYENSYSLNQSDKTDAISGLGLLTMLEHMRSLPLLVDFEFINFVLCSVLWELFVFLSLFSWSLF